MLIPPFEFCTDNAAMGAIAWEHLEQDAPADLTLDVLPGTDRGRHAERLKHHDASRR
jgi:N6-L-threonylcarbamoyladenine synthase